MPDKATDGWHPQDILAEVRKRGTTLKALERDHGFGENTLYKALTRRFPNAHSVIAQASGQSRHTLWPHWYDAADRPLLPSRPDLLRRAA
jgi:Ner family transcriptional regulator